MNTFYRLLMEEFDIRNAEIILSAFFDTLEEKFI